MLKVDIDDSIESYDENVFAGMNLRNTILSVITIFLCGIYFFILFFVLSLPVEVFCYTCFLPGLPVFILGRKRTDGLSLKLRLEKKKYQKPVLPYVSTECGRLACKVVCSSFQQEREQKNPDELQDVVRYLKRMFILLSVFMILAVGLLVLYLNYR